MKLIIDIPEDIIEGAKSSPNYYPAYHFEKIWKAIVNGIPFSEICDRENSEIKNELKDLSKRVEALENQMKEDKEEQLKKLKAELDYAKFVVL